MTIKAKVKMNLNFPRLNIQPQLEDVAKKVIRPDIQKRMTKGIGIDGQPHKKNTKATRTSKGLRGLNTAVPLVASGQLRKSFQINLIGKGSVSIKPRGTRRPYPSIKGQYRLRKRKKSGTRDQPTNNELADILQNQGVRNGRHKYNFFGISDEAEVKSIKWMTNYIKKAIKRGGWRIIR